MKCKKKLFWCRACISEDETHFCDCSWDGLSDYMTAKGYRRGDSYHAGEDAGYEDEEEEEDEYEEDEEGYGYNDEEEELEEEDVPAQRS
jgi:hypothetical protein